MFSRTFYHNYIYLPMKEGDVREIADPFVMRFRGIYYLYVTGNGLPCYTSRDLISWKYVGRTYGGDDGETDGGYAPETVYYHGKFYLCCSPNGTGHRFFRADSPTGPFVRISDNLDMGIDGSFFVSEEDRLFFVSAFFGGDGISFVELTDDGERMKVISEPTHISDPVNLGHWTEGPHHFYRGEDGYLTFTGNHFMSADYRIAYCHTRSPFLFSSLSCAGKYTPHNLVALNTGSDNVYLRAGMGADEKILRTYRGIGHSSNFCGPDLDSVYTAYHIADLDRFDGTPEGADSIRRRFALGRYFTNGKFLFLNGLGMTDCPAPRAADFEAEGCALAETDGKKLTAQEEALYTAEFDFIGEQELYLAWKNEQNFTRLTLAAGKIALTKCRDGKEETSEKPAFSGNADTAHTVRAVNGYGRAEIWLDGRRVFRLCENFGKGRLGFGKKTEGTCLRCTREAFGSSDADEPKNLPCAFPAHGYLKGSLLSKCAAPDRSGCREGEAEHSRFEDGCHFVTLAAGERADYLMNIQRTGEYVLTVRAASSSKDCRFTLTAGGLTQEFSFDGADFSEGTADIPVGTFAFRKKGIQTVRLQVTEGELVFSALSFSEKLPLGDFAFSSLPSPVPAKETVEPENAPLALGFSLASPAPAKETGEPENAPLALGFSLAEKDGEYAAESEGGEDKCFFRFGNSGLSDYEISCRIEVRSGRGGLLLRTTNFCANRKWPSNPYSFCGYYLCLSEDRAYLFKYEYAACKIAEKALSPDERARGFTFRAEKNVLSVFCGNDLIFRFADPECFPSGAFGLYAEPCSRVRFTRFSFKNLG